MDATSKGLETIKKEIVHEIRGIFKMNMKLEDWSVPEVDDKKAAREILKTMQEALDTVKQEFEAGEYENY